MNKFLLIISAFFLSACISNKDLLNTFRQQNPVVIRLSKKYNKIYRINIPIGLTVKNKSFFEKLFVTIDYVYSPYSKGIGEDIYSFDSKQLIKVKNNKKKVVEAYSSNNYVVYSRYRLDSTKATQQQFKPYVAKMIAQNKDTLYIGTVGKFKQTHAALFEQLTKNDSIAIQFLDGKKLGERITVPVRW